MKKSIANYLSKLLLLPILGLNITANANTDLASGVNTNVVFPNITKGNIFNLTNSSDHRILFYTGEKDGANVTGYFRASHFLGWTEYKFAPFEYYQGYGKKTLLGVASGPAYNTIALSNIDGLGQLLSWSLDGKNWVSQKINMADKNFNRLEATNFYSIKGAAVYGTNHTALLTSVGAQLWQLWGMPNSCNGEQNCTIENKYFGSQSNQFFLLQTRSLSGVQTNKLYTTTNLTTWYHGVVPFAQDNVQKFFNDPNSSSVFASVIGEGGSHKLWASYGLNQWSSFDLPANSTVTDAKVYKTNQIALLLQHNVAVKCTDTNCACGCVAGAECTCVEGCACNTKLTTDLAVINPETRALTTINSFEGEVSGINYFDDKLYLTGNFVNHESKDHAALVSMNL